MLSTRLTVGQTPNLAKRTSLADSQEIADGLSTITATVIVSGSVKTIAHPLTCSPRRSKDWRHG
jgi:hypothetical protein